MLFLVAPHFVRIVLLMKCCTLITYSPVATRSPQQQQQPGQENSHDEYVAGNSAGSVVMIINN